ncbi:MAG: DUF1292 domain-containing protein [Lachnospiraceae bacterium]|nr:DUF1292 domain-containing protein [Lachnospiraceae bacterium]
MAFINENIDPEEEMTVELTLTDGKVVNCGIITIFDVDDNEYIALTPLNDKGEADRDEIWFYRYSENPDDTNEEPILGYIEDDDEYEAVADAFDELLDEEEFEDFEG